MGRQKTEIYPYRWVILFVFMLVMAVQQLLWITFAPITSDAMKYYGVSNLSIGFLSMVFMIVYIILSIPASWFIDTYGFRAAVGLGAALTGIFGLLRGIFASDYSLVLIFQIGIAVGQPLIINAVTKVAVRWFPIRERATASGMAWLAGYLGLIVGLTVTPNLITSSNIKTTLLYYGIASIFAAIAFLCFAREYPPSLQYAPEQEQKALVFKGLKQIMVRKDFILLMFVSFIALGIFNGLSTWIEDVVKPRGFSPAQAGIIGGAMVASGVLGSAILPMLSDKYRNRSRFLLLAMAGSIPGLIGIAYAKSYWLMIISACVLGFFMLSSAPIGFQYGSEIAYPVSEGTSTGMIMLMGQISGVIFIFGMDMFKSPSTGSMDVSMIVLIILLILNVLICTRLKESKLMLSNDGVPELDAGLNK